MSKQGVFVFAASVAFSLAAQGASMTPVVVTGFNRDLVIETNAAGPPYGNAVVREFNPGENKAFYQSGLAGKSYGLPAGGTFTSVLDGETIFRFQPYTNNNALFLSAEATGITSGTLTLVTPTNFRRIAVLANSGDGGGTPAMTLNFSDGTAYATTYNALDWFFNDGFALQGVDRINLNSGAADGGPDDPRFYQTTIDVDSLPGLANKALASVTFEQADGSGSTAVWALSGEPASNMAPIAVTGFNRDLVIEAGSSGPPYTTAQTFNQGEGTAFYQSGLGAKTYGLPADGKFTSAWDGLTSFQFQPYTANNALVLSGDTGLTSGTLTLVAPAIYGQIAVLANSGNGTNPTGTLTLRFTDNSTFVTNYYAPNWFNDANNVALQGVERITLSSGTTSGSPTNPRFHQTTIDLNAALGANNKPLASLTFDKPQANSTGIYAVSGLAWENIAPALAAITNLAASGVLANAATLNGQILSVGGDVPTVTFYYGPADGGSNPAAWSNSITIGSQTAAFAQTVVGLSNSTTYYFTSKAVNAAGTAWAGPSLTFTTLASNPATQLTSVLTYHNSNDRIGVNTNENQLTLANVNTNSFGKLFTFPVDGFVYAQPLILTNVAIPGKGVHNVVFVATEHESVYAFDADSADGPNATPLWQVSFLINGATTVPAGDLGTTDITPEIGITSTPVIDPATGTIYVESKTKESGNYVHRLHALNVATGAERTEFNSPSVITVTNYPGAGSGDNDGSGHVLWNARRQMNRSALALYNGKIYFGYASHGDNTPYHGWLFAYNATNVAQQTAVYNSTPNGGLGGFWQGGGGPAFDNAGNFYLMTGNGDFNATGATFNPQTNNFAMAALKFTVTNGLLLTDYFSPSNQASLSAADSDFGSGAPIVLPDAAGSAAHPHLLVASGKGGVIYLLDRDNMGRFNAGNNQVVQFFKGLSGGGQDGSYSTPVYFNNYLYYVGMNDKLRAFRMTNGVIQTTSTTGSTTFGAKGSSSPSLSANGTNDAILWVIQSEGQNPVSPAVLRAYNATNVAVEIYNSSQLLARDNPGTSVKFNVPTVANGKVYVGTQYGLSVFGNGVFLATPTIAPNGGTFTNSIVVTLSDATPGTTIYYTLDSSTPTTNSLLYTGPFTLTASASVKAMAVKPGAVNSSVAGATFLNSSAIGNGIGLLGSYWSNTTSAAFTNAAFNTAPSLVRTDATVNFNWGGNAPAAGVSADHFIASWTGSVVPQFDEPYTFYMTTDDGARLWVNGQLAIDAWVDQGATEWSATVPLAAQQRYNIRMDYYENGGDASATLSWSSPSTTKAIIPQSQLFPVTNPPPVVVLTSPVSNSVYTAAASVTMSADAGAPYNDLSRVDFYVGNTVVGSVSNLPYTMTVTGLAAGNYALKAVAWDATGLGATSAPVSVTVSAGSGQPYGLTSRAATPAFLNMPATYAGSLPALLSQTGVFTNTPSMGAAGALIPYTVNTPLWSDAAVKTRWLAVPYNGAPATPDEQIGFSAGGEWTFPAGSVFVKHFSLITNEITGGQRRLETRLLVRDALGGVYGVTYKWRPDNSEADLLTGGLDEAIAITNATGVRTQIWHYPSAAQCLECHTPAASYVLGVKTRQLNGNQAYPGGTDNQLRALNRLGLFQPAFDESVIAGFAKLSSISNNSVSLEERARSYLDANCSQCHRPGGSGPTFDARYDTPLAAQNLINALLSKGDLGYDNARVVVPKDIWRSILYQRSDSLDASVKMPPLARNVVDTNAMAVLADWINSLSGTPALAPPAVVPNGGSFLNAVSVSLLSTNGGDALYYTLDGSLPDTNASLYAGPFNLGTNATVRAKAFKAGYSNSVAATALFTFHPPVLFTSGGMFTNNIFQMQISGVAGRGYFLEASTNLIDWTPLGTNIAVSNIFQLTDPNATNYPYRFYRAVELPSP